MDDVKRVRKMAFVAAGGLLAIPLGVGLAGFSPPWPPGPGLTVMTSLVELVVLVVVFQLLHRAERSTANKVVVASAVLVFLFSILHLVLNAAFVYPIPNNDNRVVMGCGLTDNARLILKGDGQTPTDECPGEFTQLLSASQYEPEKIWTRFSLTGIKAALVLTWLGAFASLASMVGVFVSFQRRQPAQPEGPPAPTEPPETGDTAKPKVPRPAKRKAPRAAKPETVAPQASGTSNKPESTARPVPDKPNPATAAAMAEARESGRERFETPEGLFDALESGPGPKENARKPS
ncbi:hypothetical protein [Variovorax sp. PBL-E5]|uniref:hypothetical protein n=2 Tax=Variovorax TaxID=34072 RepID=UPI001E619A02|nr:hypothetical protein [Variovorax sp. PBL-E5]